GKDISIKMTAEVERAVLISGAVITLLHCVYLLGIIHNTVKDLRKMEGAEKAMRATLPAGLLEEVDEDHLSARFTRSYRYHSSIQMLITAVLCAVAFFAIAAPRGDRPPATIPSSPTPAITK